MSKIMVSICCITYNQEKYISDALNSFLMQKTDFSYEILIHDDASTDRTPEIIKEYVMDYPDIIKPIYQTENQYSKGIEIFYNYNFTRAKGKYIALCEGDDYWINENKLQIQVDYMEQNPNCSLCTHTSEKVSGVKKLFGIIRPNRGDKNYRTDDVILGGGGMFATNSMLFPSNLVRSLPEFYFNAPIGDYPLTIFLSLHGDVHYIDSCMSSYRFMSEGSWSVKMKSNKSKLIELNNKIAEMLNEINDYTNYEHSTVIEKVLIDNEIKLLVENLGIKIFKNDKYAELYKKLNTKEKLKVFVNIYVKNIIKINFPFIFKLIRGLKIKLKSF